MGQLPFERIKREIFVRKQAKTSDKYGKDPSKRTITELLQSGIINLDKPKGPTSHQVSAYVQQAIGINKGGHSGTLDPKVTGVLPVALGSGTRIVQALLNSGKEYVCIMHLHSEIDKDKIIQAMNSFVGKIKQLPPIKSAIKREWRYRKIYYIDIHEIDGQDVLFTVGCQAGTYIRKLCLHPNTEILSDIGSITINNLSSKQKVFSDNNGKLVKIKPSAFQKIKSPKKLIKITLASGINIMATEDHEILKSNENGYKMTEFCKLKKGDYLVKNKNPLIVTKNYLIPDLLDDKFLIDQKNIKELCKKQFIKKYGSIRAMNKKLNIDRKAFLSNSETAITLNHLKLAGIYEDVKHKINCFKTEKGNSIQINKLNDDFFYLLGLIASDGNNTKEKNTIRHTRIKFHNKEKALIEEFLKKYKILFPSIPISEKKLSNGIIQLDSSNSLLATIAASLGIKSPQNKSDILPIIYAEENLLKSFIKGYFDGDGTSYFKKKLNMKGTYTKIDLFTSNEIDAKRLHQILLKLNINNKIFHKKDSYVISVNSLAAKKKFITDIGTAHPRKQKIFEKIMSLKSNNINDELLIGLHHKEQIIKNKNKLKKLGGNLSRISKENIAITLGFYNKASQLIKLPKLDNFIVESIKKIEYVKSEDFVYDLTIPKTHNFFIETGFISSNCHDIGLKLDTGAHMAELRRTKAGPFTESTLVTLHDLKDSFVFWKENNDETGIRECIQPIENAVTHLPKIWVLDSTVNSLCHGSDLKVPGVCKVESETQIGELAAVMTLKDELIAIGDVKMIAKDIIKAERGIAIKINKVFMDPDTYPKIEKS